MLLYRNKATFQVTLNSTILFLHTHPYEPFLFSAATKLIVGTLPPPRFTKGLLKSDDVNFCYGSRNGQLWPILDRIFDLRLNYETTELAVGQRKAFLVQHKIGICDIVASAERQKVDASDLGMRNVKLRDLVGYISSYENIDTLLFTGGNSKNGPEYLFRKHLKTYGLALKSVSDEVPRIHEFELPAAKPKATAASRIIKTVSLTAPSGAANRAIGSMASYKKLKQENSAFTTFDFRVMQYRAHFQ